MVEIGRGISSRQQMRIIFLIVTLLTLSGCAGRVYVDSSCSGLEQLGYSPPFSLQDALDIEAMGYIDCADYIRNKLGQR